MGHAHQLVAAGDLLGKVLQFGVEAVDQRAVGVDLVVERVEEIALLVLVHAMRLSGVRIALL